MPNERKFGLAIILLSAIAFVGMMVKGMDIGPVEGTLLWGVVFLGGYIASQGDKSDADNESTNRTKGSEENTTLELYVAIDKHTDEFIVASQMDLKQQSLFKKIKVTMTSSFYEKLLSDDHFRDNLFYPDKKFQSLDHYANYIKLVLSK